MFGRTKIAMVVAEFLGAGVLTFVTLAVSKSGVGFSFFIASGVGLALALLILMIGRLSQGHYNPAVTVGLWTARKIATTEAIVYIAAQFLGALVAWRTVVYLTDETLKNVAAKNFNWRVLIAEAIGAFVLTFGVASAVYQGYKGLKWAATAGGALFMGIVVAALASNAVLNPAVAMGVQSWDKSYVIGPLIGGVVGANLYALLFAPTAPAFLSRSRTRSTATSSAPARRGRKPAAKRTRSRGRRRA